MRTPAIIAFSLWFVAACCADELPGPWQATASSNAAAASLAIDGDLLTAWRSDAPQTAGDFLQIDLGAPRLARQIRVQTGLRYPADFPRGLAVSVRSGGGAFQRVASVEQNLNRQELRLRFNPETATQVRIELTESSGYHWAVAAARVFGAADPAALNEQDAVVISEDAATIVRIAAEDLREYISRATGRYLSLVTDAECAPYFGTKYAVGLNSLTKGKLADLDGLVDEAILLRASGNTVIMAGNTPRASAYAAYRLLHRLGVRWYSPGDAGEYVPSVSSIALRGLNVVHEPSIELRRLSSVRWDHLEDDMLWTIRNCLSYVSQAAMHYFDERTGAFWTPRLADWDYGTYPHSFQRQISKSEIAAHPDIQPMFDGKRRVYEARNENFCTSSPAAVELMAAEALAWFGAHPESRSFSICPQDGARWCECERCQALDEPLTMESFSRQDMRNVSDRFFTFINQVAERVAAKLPDRVITTIAYANWHQPPRFDVHPNVLVDVCQYGCSSHSVDDPSCEKTEAMRRRMLAWRGRVTHLGVYDYVLLNGKAPMTPHPYGRSVPAEIKWLAKELGIRSWWSESGGWCAEWSPAPFWLALQMAWDVEQDPKALLAEFMANYYGPAEGAREYWRIMRDRIHKDGIHYGSYNNRPSPEMFTPETIAALEAALTRAALQAPGGSLYAGRVAKLRESLEFVKQYPMEQD